MRLTLPIYLALLFCLEFCSAISDGFDLPKYLGTSNIRPPNRNQQASPLFSPEAWLQRAKDGVAPDTSIRQYQGNPVVNRDGYFLNGYQEHVPNVHQTEQEFPNGPSTEQIVPGYDQSLPILPTQTDRLVPVNEYKLNRNFESGLINQQHNLPRQYERPHTYDIKQSPIFNTLLNDRQNHVVSNPEVAYPNEMITTKMVPGSFIPQIPSRPSTEHKASNMFINENKIVSPIRMDEFRNPPVDPVTTEKHLLASASNPVETKIVRPPNYNIHRWMSNPNIRHVLSTTKHKKRYLVIHPNGTIEHIDKLETVTKNNPNYILMRAGDITTKPIQKPHDAISGLQKQYPSTDLKITTPSIPKQNSSSLPLNLTNPGPNEVISTKRMTTMKTIPESLKNKTSEDSNFNNLVETQPDIYTQTTTTTTKNLTLPILLRNITNIPANISSSSLIEIAPIQNLTTVPRNSESLKNFTSQQNNITLLVMAPQGPIIDKSKNSSLNSSSTVNLEDSPNKPPSILPIIVTVNNTKQLVKPPLNVSSKNSTESFPKITTLSISARNTSILPQNLSSHSPIETIPTTIQLIPEPLTNITLQQGPTIIKYNYSIPSTMNVQDDSLKPLSMLATATVIVNNSQPLVKPVLTAPIKKFMTKTSIKASPESSTNKTTSVPREVISASSISVPETTLLSEIPNIDMTSNQTAIKKEETEGEKSKPIIIYGNNKTIRHEKENDSLLSSSIPLKLKPINISGVNMTSDQKLKYSSSRNESFYGTKNMNKDPLVKEIEKPSQSDILQIVANITTDENNNKVHPLSQQIPSLLPKDKQQDKSSNKVSNPHKSSEIPEQKKDSSVSPTTVPKPIVEVNSNFTTKTETPMSTVNKAATSISEIPVKDITERKEASKPKSNNSNHMPKEKLTKSKTEEDSILKIPGSLDVSKVKSLEKPDIWVKTAGSEFFDKLTGGGGDYDVVYFFQIHSEPRVESDTTRTVYPNGTIVEEITKSIWENEEAPPIVTKTTRLLNPEETSTKST